MSLAGDQAVSSTAAVCVRARGMMSGSFDGKSCALGPKGDGSGSTAKAPPPDADQLILM